MPFVLKPNSIITHPLRRPGRIRTQIEFTPAYAVSHSHSQTHKPMGRNSHGLNPICQLVKGVVPTPL